jgi:hypothetical protein
VESIATNASYANFADPNIITGLVPLDSNHAHRWEALKWEACKWKANKFLLELKENKVNMTLWVLCPSHKEWHKYKYMASLIT